MLACSTSAAMIFGWQWPWFTAEYADRKSKYSLPSVSHTLVSRPDREQQENTDCAQSVAELEESAIALERKNSHRALAKPNIAPTSSTSNESSKQQQLGTRTGLLGESRMCSTVHSQRGAPRAKTTGSGW
jgi:hypothetical protein